MKPHKNDMRFGFYFKDPNNEIKFNTRMFGTFGPGCCLQFLMSELQEEFDMSKEDIAICVFEFIEKFGVRKQLDEIFKIYDNTPNGYTGDYYKKERENRRTRSEKSRLLYM